MKPVIQTRFGKPLGNCWAAAIASILELPLEVVDWSADMTAEEIEQGDNVTDEWLTRRKRRVADLGFYESFVAPADVSPPCDVHYVALGRNADGGHACVGKNGAVVHDPNPKKLGLDSLEWLVFLVRR